MKRTASLSILMTLALSMTAGAQTLDPSPTPSPPDDRSIVATIVMNAVTKLKLCDLADQKTDNGDVRLLCRRASVDNARAAIEGLQVAKKVGATDAKLEPAPGTPDEIDTLAQYSGNDFDREFLLNAIRVNENDERDLRYALEVTSDASLKRFESGQLPSIQRQLELAETALRRVSEATPP